MKVLAKNRVSSLLMGLITYLVRGCSAANEGDVFKGTLQGCQGNAILFFEFDPDDKGLWLL